MRGSPGIHGRKGPGCLFASGHLAPTVDTLECLASRAVFSCPLPSTVYALHSIGKCIAGGGPS